jgi:pantoate kinase
MPKRARAFSPAGISSFFELCDRTSEGKIISNPELIGARGGGFSPNKGVLTEVSLSDSKETVVRVFINEILYPEAETTMSVVNMLIEKVNQPYEITVVHNVDVPIGAGFGSSAAGSLGTALALSKVLDLNLTYNQLGRIAHVAEVKSKTGLGTVGPLLFGGCGLSIEPGAPGIAHLDRIPVPSDHRLIMGTFNPYPTKKFLSSDKKRELINKWGRKTLKNILENPSLENFMKSCKDFAIGTGFVTERVKKLINLSEKAGAVGATQNMIGEAVHALVTVDHMKSVYDVFRTFLTEEKIITAKIASQGARLIG